MNPKATGTKVAALYPVQSRRTPKSRSSCVLPNTELLPSAASGDEFEKIFAQRLQEADDFYAEDLPRELSTDESAAWRARPTRDCSGASSSITTSFATGWRATRRCPSRQLSDAKGRNADWSHLYNRDVISMPDKWEYPWYAAWDLAFHMMPLARVDPAFAKEQLVLLLREWYMHPNGQIARL